jgi:chloramphenicol-sensitive protein RarD
MAELPSPSAAAGTAVPPLRSVATLTSQGLAAGAAAFAIWGFFPIYLYFLRHVSALQVTAHRVVWSLVFVLVWMSARQELSKISAALLRPGVPIRLLASAVLISVNWLAFVWAISNDKVVEVSLGYYINPLLNVLLGIVVLSERLNRLQWVAVGLATAGVVYLTIETGQIPWIALTVATSFSVYGLIRKTASVDALPGLAIETIMLTPLALGYLIWCEANGIGALGHTAAGTATLLFFSGLVTALPLFLFAYGARQVPYSTMGVLQYIAPSLQLVCAVFFFGEPFERGRLIGFLFIWAALFVYAWDGLFRTRRR